MKVSKNGFFGVPKKKRLKKIKVKKRFRLGVENMFQDNILKFMQIQFKIELEKRKIGGVLLSYKLLKIVILVAKMQIR